MGLIASGFVSASNVRKKKARMFMALTSDDHAIEYIDTDGRLLLDTKPVKFDREQPLTRMVRQFAKAVANGGTDDYRFGAQWAVDVAKVLEAVQSAAGTVTQIAG
jgi:hypothetical protein